MPFGTPPTHPWGLLQCPRCPDADVFNAGYLLAVAYHSVLDSLLLFRQLNIWVDLFTHSVLKSHNISKDVIRRSELICYIWLFVPVVLVCVREKHSRNPQISHQTQQLATTWPGHMTLLALISLSLPSSSHQWRLYVSACRCGRETGCQFWSTVLFLNYNLERKLRGAGGWPSSSIILKIKRDMLQYQEAFSTLLTPQAAKRGCP